MTNVVINKAYGWMGVQDTFPPRIHVNPIVLQQWGNDVDILVDIGCVIIPDINVGKYELREM